MTAITLLGFVLGYPVLGWIATGRAIPLHRFWRNWLYNSHVTVSQAISTILLFGDPDESISGRIGKQALQGKHWALWLDRACWHHFVLSVETDRGHNSAAEREVVV